MFHPAIHSARNECPGDVDEEYMPDVPSFASISESIRSSSSGDVLNHSP